MEMVGATAPCGIVGLGCVFGGKLHFAKDIVDDTFVPKNRKSKPIPKPSTKPDPKPAPRASMSNCLAEAEWRKGLLFYST